MVLSTIHHVLTDEIKQTVQSNGIPTSTKELKVPGKRWLLSKFHSYLGSLLEVHCKHFRYGSVVMLQYCDHIKAISSLQGRAVTCKPLKQPNVTTTEEKQVTIEDKIEEVSSFLNERLHKQAREITQSNQGSFEKCRSLNLKAFIGTLDPVLLRFVRRITQPVRSNKRLFEDPDPDSFNTRAVRHLYSLCVLLFCTDNSCSMPVHVI